MSREKIFEQTSQPKLGTEEKLPPQELTEWEAIKARHLAAKEAFHKARVEANRTGREKYLDNKFRKHLPKDPEKPTA